jgi:hypothetical protein
MLRDCDSETFRFQQPDTSTFSFLSLLGLEKCHLGSYQFPYGGDVGYCPRVQDVYSERINDLSILFIILQVFVKVNQQIQHKTIKSML